MLLGSAGGRSVCWGLLVLSAVARPRIRQLPPPTTPSADGAGVPESPRQRTGPSASLAIASSEPVGPPLPCVRLLSPHVASGAGGLACSPRPRPPRPRRATPRAWARTRGGTRRDAQRCVTVTKTGTHCTEVGPLAVEVAKDLVLDVAVRLDLVVACLERVDGRHPAILLSLRVAHAGGEGLCVAAGRQRGGYSSGGCCCGGAESCCDVVPREINGGRNRWSVVLKRSKVGIRAAERQRDAP